MAYRDRLTYVYLHVHIRFCAAPGVQTESGLGCGNHPQGRRDAAERGRQPVQLCCIDWMLLYSELRQRTIGADTWKTRRHGPRS
jgi:hypothetical protein